MPRRTASPQGLPRDRGQRAADLRLTPRALAAGQPVDLAAPHVTVATFESNGRTEMTRDLELRPTMPDDGVLGWWQHAEHVWRDTVDQHASS